MTLLHVRAGFENSTGPRVRLVAEVNRLRELVATQQDELRIRRARISSLPARSRLHYKPGERFAILALRAKAGWSRAETARRFVLTAKTVAG